MSTLGERLSATEYLARDDPRHTELIDGVVVVNQPTFLHQRTCFAVAKALDAWARAAPGRGTATLSLDVVLPSGDVLAPDVLWFAEPLPVDAVRAPRVPDLAVEVRSTSTWARDVTLKADLYRTHGLRELWLADTAARSVLVLRAGTDRAVWAEQLEVPEDATLTSSLLPGFAAPVASLFA